MKKHKIINLSLLFVIILISVLPMLLFRDKIEITKHSILVICLLAFHLFYGLAAYYFRYKGNYLRFKPLFLKHFWFNFIEPNKDYTSTKEYRQKFYRMLAVYFAVVPLYIPCIFLISSGVSATLSIIIFLIPQALFIYAKAREVSNDISQAKQKQQQEEQERKEQKRREEMGRWK